MNKSNLILSLVLVVFGQSITDDWLKAQIKQTDDVTERLKSINQQLRDHNDRMNAMIKTLSDMLGGAVSAQANQSVLTNIYTTNSVYWTTNNSEAEWKKWKEIAESNRDYIKEMELSGSLTNTINLLVTSGKLCAVRGHVWGEHMHVTLEYEPGRIGCRECKLCGLHQSKHATDWK